MKRATARNKDLFSNRAGQQVAAERGRHRMAPNMSREDASIIIDLIGVMEELTNHEQVVQDMAELGCSAAEVDSALKALGSTAHRDCGWL